MSRGQANNGGRFTSEYSDRDLVAEVAGNLEADAPALVTQTAWDAGRSGAGHPTAPSARAICDRLTRHSGRPHPWPELLVVALDPERNFDHTLARRRGSVESPDLGPRHLYFALNLAAQHLDQPSLGPDQYARARTSSSRGMSGGTTAAAGSRR